MYYELWQAGLVGVFGLAVGSFLNVLVYRLNTSDGVAKFWQGRSLCPKCKHTLSWKDNIPLLSFILLGGQCRYCKKKISFQYPIVELITAMSFALIGPNPLLLALAAVFIVIFFSDLIYGLIPDEAVAAGIVISFLRYLSDLSYLRAAIAVGIISAGTFLGVVLLTRFRGMGLGDVKLAFLMGWLLGWPNVLVAFWSAFIIGGMGAMGLLMLKKVKFSATIPLGPFLVIGTIISALWSTPLLHILGF